MKKKRVFDEKRISFILIIALLVSTISYGYVDLGYRPPSADRIYFIHYSMSSTWANRAYSAANTWNNVNAGVKFIKGGYCHQEMDVQDSYFSVMYDSFLAYGWPADANAGFARFNTGDYGDIVMNSLRSWGDGNSTSYLDGQGLLTHEFGHSIGLGDVYSASDVQTGNYTDVTMYGHSDYSMLNSYGQRTLHQDDINGIRALWP